MQRSIYNIFILHKLVIWKILIILIQKNIQLSLWHKKSPNNMVHIKVTPCFLVGHYKHFNPEHL